VNVRTPTLGLQRLAASGSGPLYRQARRELQRLVESGRYAPGETLPSEAVLAQALGVSIGTLRKAVDELVHEHVLVRHQGKGTYVALHNDDRFLFQFFHVEPRGEFGAGDELRGREYPHVDCVGFERGRAEEGEAAALRLRAGDLVLRIANRLSLAGRPVVHDRLVLAAQTFKGLTEKRFLERPGTIYSLYQTDYGITVLRARERARAVSAGRETARVLGVAIGMPVLEVHRLALTFGDKPVEYRVSTIDTAGHDYVSLLAKRP
jgi:GntR family transcriptional regulator